MSESIMTVFLLIISFIIDGVIIIGMLTLSTRLKKSEEIELRQEQVASEIEDLFTSYLMEIKEENNRLSQLLAQSPPNSGSQDSPRRESVKQDKKSNYSQPINQPRDFDQTEEYVEQQPRKVKEYSPPEPEEDPATYQPSLHSQVIELFNNGNSIEEIARKLDRGKTEVELIVKFHQKNDLTT